MVQLDSTEVFTGWASCDDIETIWPDEVTRDLGAITPRIMTQVEEGLRAALGF
jgi:mRNA-degrading endonuclease toxin of MazEF toxin-antitoxin module